MTETIVTILVSLMAFLAFVGLIVYQVVSRGLQMRELYDHGIETTGTVTNKRRTSARQGRTEKLAYEYTDNTGRSHSHTSVVSMAVYHEHEEGQPIRVVYSAKRPEVSAPLYLVEQSRKALGKA